MFVSGLAVKLPDEGSGRSSKAGGAVGSAAIEGDESGSGVTSTDGSPDPSARGVPSDLATGSDGSPARLGGADDRLIVLAWAGPRVIPGVAGVEESGGAGVPCGFAGAALGELGNGGGELVGFGFFWTGGAAAAPGASDELASDLRQPLAMSLIRAWVASPTRRPGPGLSAIARL